MAPWAAVLLYLALTLPQLDLPGLHYDEAKEAGLNAMEILLRQPVYAFRSAGIQVGETFFPLMVQDYIGALNVYLALPVLVIFGISVPALRLLAVIYGLGTLLLVGRLGNEIPNPRSPIRNSRAGAIAMLLLAASPSFIFWSRQGIFVTNVVVALATATVWLGLRWLRGGRPHTLYLLALLAGLGLWAKLLFVWVLVAMAILALALLARHKITTPALPHGSPAGVRACASVPLFTIPQLAISLLIFLAALAPLILFNQQTAGTLDSLFGNPGQSYYGVQNANFLANLAVRLAQLATLLRGDHFWYLGGPFANGPAPWIALGLVVLALLTNKSRRSPLLWLLLFVSLLVIQTCFTVSDLFITHFAIVQPFLILLVALAVDALLDSFRFRGSLRVIPAMAALALLTWLALDLRANFNYHRALTESGGHAAHSDATYRLAEWLEQQPLAPTDPGFLQPLALDWGIEAPLRYLTENRVQPLELFGYERLDAADPAFGERLAPFLDDPGRLYLAHMAADTVFQGRREAFETAAAERELTVVEAATFSERSGRPLLVVLQARRYP